MNDAERQALWEHARQLLDLGPKWRLIWQATGRGWITVHMSGPLSAWATITIAPTDHAAWLASRAEPLPDDAHIAPNGLSQAAATMAAKLLANQVPGPTEVHQEIAAKPWDFV